MYSCYTYSFIFSTNIVGRYYCDFYFNIIILNYHRALPGQRGYGRNQGSSFGARKKGAGVGVGGSFGVSNAITGSDIPFPQAPKSPGVRQPPAIDPLAGN